ncbi:MAG: MFS transporter [Euryarchaeota archaeon]|nr:MFS transporter [Euryarchaeota archaeon]
MNADKREKCSVRQGFRSTLLISIVGFLVSFGFSLLTPVLPLYALTFGIDLAMVGILVASIGITKVVLDIPAGVVSDRVGTKRFMILGLLLVAISAIIAALARDYMMLLIGLIIQGAGSAVYFTSSYLAVSRLCPISKRGRHLGLFVSLQFLGSTSGPLVGGLFGQSFGLGTPFFIYALLAAVSLIMVHLGIKGTQVEGVGGNIDIRQLVVAFRDRTLAAINIGLLSISVVRIGLIATILPIFAARNLNISPAEFGAVLTAFSFANFLTLLPAGVFSDRLGRRPFMFASLMITGILVLLLSLANDVIIFSIIMIAMGAALGLTGPIGAWVSDISSPARLGASMGLFRTMGDVGSFIGPIVLTAFLPTGEEGIGSTPFILAGVLAIAASLILIRARDPAAEKAKHRKDSGKKP